MNYVEYICRLDWKLFSQKTISRLWLHVSLKRMDLYSESARLLHLGHIARTCLRRKAWTICKPQRSQNVIRDKWHDVDDQTMRKAILQWKRCLAGVAKQNGLEDLFSTFSVNQFDWWLLWRFDVACVLQAMTWMMNRLQILFYDV